jgi:hypothetical protein
MSAAARQPHACMTLLANDYQGKSPKFENPERDGSGTEADRIRQTVGDAFMQREAKCGEANRDHRGRAKHLIACV